MHTGVAHCTVCNKVDQLYRQRVPLKAFTGTASDRHGSCNPPSGVLASTTYLYHYVELL